MLSEEYGATASIPRAFFSIASASFNVSVGFVPNPIRTPPEFAEAERTIRRFEPMDSISFAIFSHAPVPTASIIMTALTPIIIPKLVSIERILFIFNEIIAILNIDLKSSICQSFSFSKLCLRR